MPDITILYRTDKKDPYERTDLKLSHDEFYGLLLFTRNYLGYRFGDPGTMKTTDYFAWCYSEDCPADIHELPKQSGSLGADIADIVVDPLIGDSISLGQKSLPVFNHEDWLDYLHELDPDIQLKHLQENTAVISNPNDSYWFIVTYNGEDLLRGVYQGSLLFKAAYIDYVKHIFQK